jgi:hypothetical protein
LDKKNAWQYVGDANLEILQGKKLAKKYIEQHPEIGYAPKLPARGTFLINTEQYLDTWNTGDYQWLRKYKPVSQVGYSWLVIKSP